MDVALEVNGAFKSNPIQEDAYDWVIKSDSMSSGEY